MRIHNKLFFTLILFGTFLVFTIAALAQWSIDKGMVEYVNTREATALQPLVEELAKSYPQTQNWRSLASNPRLFHYKVKSYLIQSHLNEEPEEIGLPPHLSSSMSRHPPPNDRDWDRGREARGGGDYAPPPRRPPPRDRTSPRERENEKNYVLVDTDKKVIIGEISEKKSYSYIPITVKDQVVGYLAIAKRVELTEGYEFDFIKSQHDFMWFIALGLMLLVILVTLPVARNLVTPLRTLTKGMHQLTQGNYQQKMSLKRKDELGDLSRDFNELASTLEQADIARKRWLANVSHELRTPVAILRGELEAMIDGVRPLSKDNVVSASQEVQHLERLIDDLQILTRTDIGGMTYRKEVINVVTFFQNESKKYQDYLSEAGLKFIFEYSMHQVFIYADTTRLCQLIDNLLNNSIKYASTGTQVKISINRDKNTADTVNIIIEDDGQGVDEVHLPHLFEHLYRVEDSRNRKTGGSGLGLSICAHIVEAHQGKITARDSSLGGLAVIISLPITQSH